MAWDRSSEHGKTQILYAKAPAANPIFLLGFMSGIGVHHGAAGYSRLHPRQAQHSITFHPHFIVEFAEHPYLSMSRNLRYGPLQSVPDDLQHFISFAGDIIRCQTKYKVDTPTAKVAQSHPGWYKASDISMDDNPSVVTLAIS